MIPYKHVPYKLASDNVVHTVILLAPTQWAPVPAYPTPTFRRPSVIAKPNDRVDDPGWDAILQRVDRFESPSDVNVQHVFS